MTNRRLSDKELKTLFHPLFAEIVKKLNSLSGDDEELLFALRRKLCKELSYLERDKPAVRKKLKKLLWKEQGGLCHLCKKELPQNGKGAHLHRVDAKRGYEKDNTVLIHGTCHVEQQEQKGYA